MSRQYSTADCQGLRGSHTAQPLFTGSAAQGKFSQIASHRAAKPRTLQRSSRPTLRIKFPSEVFVKSGRVSQPRAKSAAQPDREVIVAIRAIHSQLILQFYGVASRATFSFSSRGSKRKKASVSPPDGLGSCVLGHGIRPKGPAHFITGRIRGPKQPKRN